MSKSRLLYAGMFLIVATAVTIGVVTAREPNAPPVVPNSQTSVGSGFTYQGRLDEDGIPVNGMYDFRFILFNSSVGGSQVGEIFAPPPVDVVNGLFTVIIDFGSDVFNGDARWLEIASKVSGGPDDFSVMSPRQPITPVPYALFTTGAWSMNGNSGTDPQADFLGTTDNQPLVIKTNGIEAVRIDEQGNLGLGTNLPNATFDVNGDIAVGGNTIINQQGEWVGDSAGLRGDVGFSCWDANENGVKDQGEDINGDSEIDVQDCQGQQGETGPQGAIGPQGDPAPLFPDPSDIVFLHAERVDESDPPTCDGANSFNYTVPEDKFLMITDIFTSASEMGLWSVERSALVELDGRVELNTPLPLNPGEEICFFEKRGNNPHMWVAGVLIDAS